MEGSKGMPKITIAVAGNPNTGKTTMFNNLTGARQHVGNWPGVTVEKKWGSCRHNGYDINVVDLPGVYSLTAYSPDELVARRFVVEEKPDVVVDIVDASNLERNLYLVTQFLELGTRVIVALNMSDVAESRDHHIDAKKLSELIGAPIVRTVANRNKGTTELLDEIVSMAENPAEEEGFKVNYGKEIEREIERLEGILSRDEELSRKYSPRWLAIKLLEEDEEVAKIVQGESC
jgi:ferrous iron transport protein B